MKAQLWALKKLRLLMILGCFGLPEKGNSTPKLDYLSNNLRLLEWNRFPFKEFPPTFLPNKLAKLKLVDSNLERLFWNKLIKVTFKNLYIIFLNLDRICVCVCIYWYKSNFFLVRFFVLICTIAVNQSESHWLNWFGKL